MSAGKGSDRGPGGTGGFRRPSLQMPEALKGAAAKVGFGAGKLKAEAPNAPPSAAELGKKLEETQRAAEALLAQQRELARQQWEAQVREAKLKVEELTMREKQLTGDIEAATKALGTTQAALAEAKRALATAQQSAPGGAATTPPMQTQFTRERSRSSSSYDPFGDSGAGAPPPSPKGQAGGVPPRPPVPQRPSGMKGGSGPGA